MECDSMHSSTERKLTNKFINVPMPVVCRNSLQFSIFVSYYTRKILSLVRTRPVSSNTENQFTDLLAMAQKFLYHGHVQYYCTIDFVSYPDSPTVWDVPTSSITIVSSRWQLGIRLQERLPFHRVKQYPTVGKN